MIKLRLVSLHLGLCGRDFVGKEGVILIAFKLAVNTQTHCEATKNKCGQL